MSLPRAVRTLLIANGLVYACQVFLPIALVRYGGLAPAMVARGAVWQLFTYMFLHGGLFHLLFNMLALWMFGRDLEYDWGSRAFFKYYLVCGVGAGLITTAVLWGQSIPTIGASGAIFGLLLAFGMAYPDRYIYLWFFLPVKAKYMVIIFGLLELAATLQYSADGVGHFTHLGGLVAGFVYLKVGNRPWRFPRLLSSLGQIRARRKARTLRRRWDEHRDLMDAVDRILDRINEVGYENLTDEEKSILDRASKRLSIESHRK